MGVMSQREGDEPGVDEPGGYEPGGDSTGMNTRSQ